MYWKRPATHCKTLQNTDTLQRTATHCKTLQNIATLCNTLQNTTTTHCSAKRPAKETCMKNTNIYRSCVQVSFAGLFSYRSLLQVFFHTGLFCRSFALKCVVVVFCKKKYVYIDRAYINMYRSIYGYVFKNLCAHIYRKIIYRYVHVGNQKKESEKQYINMYT